MKKFLLFIAGIVALMILIANLGPIVLLGVCVWLLYIVFKKFIKSDSVFAKIGWVVLGLLIVSVGISNIYAVIGIAAAYVLYLVVTKWNGEEEEQVGEQDPFINFEEQWKEFKY